MRAADGGLDLDQPDDPRRRRRAARRPSLAGAQRTGEARVRPRGPPCRRGDRADAWCRATTCRATAPRSPGSSATSPPPSTRTWPPGSSRTSASPPPWSTGSRRSRPARTWRRPPRPTGVDDRAAVVTEPFTEWVISGAFAGGRPRWEDVGATFTDDVEPFEDRKLWMLNGAHTMLAYAGSTRGHVTVADAMRDPVCRQWLDEWWDVASQHLDLPAASNDAYRAALVDRFANPSLAHRLDQIAWDGSQKLPIRILPTLRSRARRRPAPGRGRPPAGRVGVPPARAGRQGHRRERRAVPAARRGPAARCRAPGAGGAGSGARRGRGGHGGGPGRRQGSRRVLGSTHGADLALVRPRDPITLAQVCQTGATGIVTALHEIPNGQAWPVEAVAERKEMIEAAGLVWSVVESIPVHEDIKRAQPQRDRWIAAYQDSIRAWPRTGSTSSATTSCRSSTGRART